MNLDNLPIARPALTKDIATLLLEHILSDGLTIEQISDYAEEMGLWNTRFLEQIRRRRYSPWTLTEIEHFLFGARREELDKLNVINFYEEVKKHEKDFIFLYLLRVYNWNSLQGIVIRYIRGDTKNLGLIASGLDRYNVQQLQKLAKHLKDRKSIRSLGWATFHDKLNRKRNSLPL